MILIHNVMWIGFNKCTLHNETMLCVRVMVLQVMKFYAVKWPFQHKQHEQCTLNTLQCGAIDALLLCFIWNQININWHTLIQTNTPTTIHSCMCGQIQVTCHLQHRTLLFCSCDLEIFWTRANFRIVFIILSGYLICL